MDNVRCSCQKIICQLEDNEIIIRCRHCKKYLVIKMPGPPVSIEERLPGRDAAALLGTAQCRATG